MKYVSLFSGIGGLEAADVCPEYFCDSDPDCAVILSRSYPNVPIYPDVRRLPKVRADVCVAGWPCQDITLAGRQAGMRGSHSSLFFKAIEAAVSSKVHTIIGENVPNLLRLRSGAEFGIVLKSLVRAGFPYIAWRSLNAREFDLPQDRERVILVASKQRRLAVLIHRPIDLKEPVSSSAKSAAGFYWTGGLRSICYSEGFVPALKVGASPPKGGTSPVAVFYRDVVRKLSAKECVRLQGFSDRLFKGVIPGSIFRMAGNAVPRPMGIFAVETANCSGEFDPPIMEVDSFGRHGFFADGTVYSIRHSQRHGANNLYAFLDKNSPDSLSNQAAAGLLSRIIRAEKDIPLPLFDALYRLSTVRTKLLGTKVDSFTILHDELKPQKYRAALCKRQLLELDRRDNATFNTGVMTSDGGLVG